MQLITSWMWVGRARPLDLIHFELSAVPSKTIYRVLSDAATSTEDSQAGHFGQYAIKEAIEHLNNGSEISVNDMASLEFRYIALLGREDDAIPNLERQINEIPEMFAQAVAFSFGRSDDQEDPQSFQTADEDLARARAQQAYRLLDGLNKIPGRSKDGKLDGERLAAWISAVRSSLKKWARIEIGDIQIGQLLAKAPVGADGVWPCGPVRDAMEKTLNKNIGDGFRIGKYNLRGAHWRGEGGSQERDLAAQYEKWAASIAFKHPKVAKVLREIRDHYLSDAKREDTEANIRRRLMH